MKISKSTKNKLILLLWFFVAVVFCIFWLSAVIKDNYESKKIGFSAERHLSLAAEALENYSSTQSADDWNRAAENFHAFSVLAYEGMTKVKGDFIGPAAAENCYSVSEAMLINREAVIPRADDILKAITLLKDDLSSPEAARIIKEIRDSALGGAAK